MEFNVRRIPIILFALVALASPAKAQRILGDSEISAALLGKSAVFSDRSIATYSADGSYNYVASNNLYYTGKYTISNGKVCVKIERGQERCDSVAADAYSAYLTTGEADVRRFSIYAPIVLQNVTTICGVPVAYSVYPPIATVPPELAAFSGTWVGKWEYGMCGALVVESVQPSGVATVIYINGDFSLERSFKANSLRFLAKISDTKLSDGGKTTSFEAVMKDKDTLAVRKIGGPGAGTARFKRQ